MMGRAGKKAHALQRRYTILVLLTIVGVLIILFFAPLAKSMVILEENIALAFFPSAERALKYGDRHFDAQHPALYDIRRAEILYEKAKDSDPDLLYVNHQLARIAFLNGNLYKALSYIEKEITLHGEKNSQAYYMQGLILGYLGRYDESAQSYATFLTTDYRNWAGNADYSWVLLKAGRAKEARDVTASALQYFPHNPWLLNINAVANYETGNISLAKERIQEAAKAVEDVTTGDWLTAYPGNDPKIAGEGVATLKQSIADNMHTIEAALASNAVE